MSVNIDIGCIKAHCLSVINKALQASGQPVKFERSEADGSWGIQVNPDLSIELSGYAADGYPRGIRLGDLTLVDIAHLTEAAADMLGTVEAGVPK